MKKILAWIVLLLFLSAICIGLYNDESAKYELAVFFGFISILPTLLIFGWALETALGLGDD